MADGVEGLNAGDRVCAGLPWGGFAEQAVVDARNVFRIPDSLGYDAATQFPTIYATAYGALVWRARMQRSEEHTSELQSLMRISYDVFCLKKKKPNKSKQVI